MSWVFTEPNIVPHPVDETDTVQHHPLGTIKRARHETFGEGEFIYLKGVASTVVGSPVTYNTTDYTTTLAAVGSNLPRPVAFAMSANVADQYGWYQISGIAVAKKSASVSLAANAAVGVLTAGNIAGTGSGKEVQSALVAAVASAKSDVTSVQLVIDRPAMQGRIS